MGHTYASSDWHGCWAPAKQVLDFLQPDDTLYFLGDAIDRGPDGIKIVDTLLKDKRVKYIMGNHEDFLVKVLPLKIAYEKYLDGDEDAPMTFKDMDKSEIELWMIWNGGEATWINLIETYLDYKTRYKHYVSALRKLPKRVDYKSPAGHTCILTHAGFDCDNKWKWGEDYLWDRDHISSKATPPQDTYIIHGHTPVQCMYEFGCPDKKDAALASINETVLWYNNHTKLDIDLCTVKTNKVALVDLDTFDVRYFGLAREQ